MKSGGSEIWSGEATRRGGFATEETRVDINISGSAAAAGASQDGSQRKERPVWMVESTVIGADAQVNITQLYLNRNHSIARPQVKEAEA